MNNYPPYDPKFHSQDTTAGHYPQFPSPGQSYPQWNQQPPVPPVPPGQYPQQPTRPPLPHQKTRFWQWYKRQSGKKQAGLGCLFIMGLLMVCGMCGSVANAGNSTQQPTQVADATATSTPTPEPTIDQSLMATVLADTPTPTPTATPTPVPTQAPVQQPVQQQPVQQSQPQQAAPPPATTGVYGNPWGYDFTPGTVITSPNSEFCNGVYFSCIQSFWSGQGYVMECGDGLYSKSGGRSGSCSKHGGDKATLYQH